MTTTITEPTAAQQQVHLYNSGMKGHGQAVLDTGTKYAVALIKLANGVSQPSDYPALKSAIEAITGVSEISLLIDTNGTPASIPTGKQLVMVVDANIRIDNEPEA